MKFKKIINVLLPPIFFKIKRWIITKRQTIYPLPKLPNEDDKLIIIGNGPSLNKTLELYKYALYNKKTLMVNFAASTDLFIDIRPSIYMLVDPSFFTPNDQVKKLVDQCVADIVSRTNWKMNLVMPKKAKNWYAIPRFEKNSNINILYYEDRIEVPIGTSMFEAWDNNLISPPAQTVLNTALWLSIYWGYKEVYLVGVDTSFLKDIYVGQTDNLLYTIDSHYYDNKKVYDFELEPEKHGRRFGIDMEHFLEAIHIMFKSYRELREYAEWKGVMIYNASEYSMLDIFQRKKLD